jgi:hypothetical protein
MYIWNNWYVLYVLVDCRRAHRQSVKEENVHNTFQGIDYGAGPEVRPATSIIHLLKPNGHAMHQQVQYFNNCTLWLHYIYVCVCVCVYFVFVWEQTATCATYIKNCLVL